MSDQTDLGAHAKRADPATGPQSEQGKGLATVAQRDNGADEKSTIALYFADNGRGMMQAHQRWRSATLMARVLTVAFGLLLIALPTALAWRTAGTLTWSAVEAVANRPDLLIPGLSMVVVGLMPWIWRFGWELPAGLLLAIFAAELFFFQPDRPRMTVALAAFAFTAIVYGCYLRWQRGGAPGNIEDLEQRVDTATDKVLERAIGKALKDAPFPIEYAPGSWRVLKTIPDRSRLPVSRIQCLVGEKKQLRINPLGFAAFSFRDHALAIVQGAVDLTAEKVLFTHAEELSYSELQGLHWTQESPLDDGKQDKDSAAESSGPVLADASQSTKPQQMSFAGLRQSLRGEARVRQMDNLTIDLQHDRQIVLVFRDSAAVDRKVSANQIESIDKIRKVWAEVSERRLAAARRSAGGS